MTPYLLISPLITQFFKVFIVNEYVYELFYLCSNNVLPKSFSFEKYKNFIDNIGKISMKNTALWSSKKMRIMEVILNNTLSFMFVFQQ